MPKAPSRLLNSEGESRAVTTTRLRFCVTSAVLSSSCRLRLAALPASGAVKLRPMKKSKFSEAASLAAAASLGVSSSTRRRSEPTSAGAMLATIVESALSGSGMPRTLMVQLLGTGSPS